MALKRVCDITGTDRDVEICDVTIAGQTIKLDLAPAGVDKLREFFGPVVTVRHPTADSNSNEHTHTAAHTPSAAAAVDESAADESESDESEEDSEAGAETAAMAAAAEPASRESAGSERSARRGRRPASVKGARKKTVARRAAKPVAQAQAQATAEIREWARANGFEVGERGAIPGRIRSAYTLAHE